MTLSVIYLFQRFFYRLAEFLRHWYWDSGYWITRQAINILERLDRFFALRINFRLLFKPLYQDYTIVGRVLGFVLRSIRVAAASVIYFLVIVIATTVYFFWALIPVLIFFNVFRNL